MTFRARQRLFSLAIVGPFYALAALGSWWIITADSDRAIAVRAAILLAPFAIAYGVLRYWPTRRRPPRLYHLTTRSAADTVSANDGGRTLQLRARKAAKPIYFFAQPPRRSTVLYWNLRAEPEVCIELHDIDYDGVDVRRRITGAYRLGGPITAGATVHPFPSTSREGTARK